MLPALWWSYHEMQAQMEDLDESLLQNFKKKEFS